MRRGGRARRAMLGAVATGALLGAAQGFNLGWKSLLASATAQSDGEAGGYTGRAVSVSSWGNRLAVGEAKADESKSQVSAEMSPVHRRRLAERLLSQVPTIDFVPNEATFNNTYDGTYTVVTAAGLEIEIDSTSVAGGYPSACTSDITLDLNAGEITCTVAGSEGGNTEYTNLRTADGSPDVSVPDVVSACAAGTLAVDKNELDEITCTVPADEPVITTYTVAAEAGNTVDLSTCDGITLDENNGKITCTSSRNLYVAEGIVVTETEDDEVTTIAKAGTELASAGGDFIIELYVNGNVTASAVDASPSPTASPPPCRTSPSPCRTSPSPCRTSPSPTRTSQAAAARRPRPPRRRWCPAR